MFQRLAQRVLSSWARAPLARRVALGTATVAGAPSLLAATLGLTANSNNEQQDNDNANSEQQNPTLYASYSATDSDGASHPLLPVPASFKSSLPLDMSDRERQIRRRNGIPETVLEGDTVLERHAALASNRHRVRFTPWEMVFFLELERFLPQFMQPGMLQRAKGIIPFDYQVRMNITRVLKTYIQAF